MSNKIRISIMIFLLLVSATIATANTVTHAAIWNKIDGKYILTDIGNGMGDSSALSINNLGQIVGYIKNQDGNRHAYIWDKVGNNYVPTDLGMLKGGQESSAVGINDKGQIIGYSYNQAIFTSNAIMWNKVGRKYTLIDIGSGFAANSINNNGQIVGNQMQSGSIFYAPIIWNFVRGKSIPIELKMYGGYSGYTANSINNKGQIVGDNMVIGAGVYHDDAVIWNTFKDNSILLSPENFKKSSGKTTVARKINDKGKIIGSIYDTSRPSQLSGVSHAAMWTKVNGKYISTFLPEGVDWSDSTSSAKDINNKDQVIGSITNYSIGVYDNATIWTIVNGKYMPQNLGTNRELNSINDKGQIVGSITYEN